MFKKVVVADTCAIYVNDVFANYTEYSGPTLMLGAVFFAFQIYGDFSGYSDIAIGTARLFGIHLMTNFRMPYFSRDIAEFWRRWHISLSTWFRDYLYIPLGGSRVGKWKAVRNTFVIFLVSGFWHGANWTFIVWGLIHALLFLPLLLRGRNRQHTEDLQCRPSMNELRGMIGTFVVVTVAWVFFRADNLTHAVQFLSRWVDLSGTNPTPQMLLMSLVLAAALLGDWLLQRGRFYPKPKALRWGLYLAIATCVVLGWNDEANQFIYFQF